ncbi:MAG: helix-hairpin-helix domain-containing protein, partial [Gemmatimonadaceae bacterium]|nr:helix-hairpin-helix domain-containing protein [Chitinophagaceae bacterium]
MPGKKFPADDKQEIAQLNRRLDSMLTADSSEGIRQPYRVEPTTILSHSPTKLFAFDPNTIDESGWRSLGIRDRTIKTIMNYRNKGGMFRTQHDLGKMYGLSPADFGRLQPFIRIKSNGTEARVWKAVNNYSFKERDSTRNLRYPI